MNSSRRYLPISLALMLTAGTAGAAHAGSALDPYSHIKPPASKVPAKRTPSIPQMDSVEKEQHYVTVIPQSAEDENKPKKGILGKTMAGMSGIAAPFAKGGKMIATSAKASGDMAKKGTGVFGKDRKPAEEKPESKIAKNEKKASPSRIASVDDWYIKETANTVAADNSKRAHQLVKGDSKAVGTQSAFLPQKRSKFASLNPLNKIGLKPKANSSQDSIRPQSGFLDAVSNPDEEVLAEMEKEKAKVAAANKAKQEKFTPISNSPEEEQRLAKERAKDPYANSNLTASKPSTKPVAKKSKLGGLSLAKFKPQMPGIPGLKKDKKSAPAAIAAAPKKPVESRPTQESQVSIDPREEDLTADGTDIQSTSAQPATAFRTGDKAIDSAVAKSAPVTHVNKVAKDNTKKSKLAAMKGGFGLPKMNFLGKKKAPPAQTATKDAPKQM